MIISLRKNIAIIVFAGSVLLGSCEKNQPEGTVWTMNSIENLGGNSVVKSGNPVIISDAEGDVVEFDGIEDGMLINQNPIANMQEFRIDVELKPYRGGVENREQRFLHLQDPGNEDRRILLELRLNNKNEWYGDWFLKTEKGSLTLIDSSFTHPVEEWATMSLEYKNGQVKGFVNGNLEVSAEFEFLPVGPGGKTSIGTRMDQRSWFKGAIRKLSFSPEVSTIH